MCAMIHSGSVFFSFLVSESLLVVNISLYDLVLSIRFSLKMKAQHDQGRRMRLLVLSVMGGVRLQTRHACVCD